MKTDRAAEMLAHCLGGTIDHRRVPGHSHNSLTPSDIAASLHAITDPIGRLLVQVKHLCLHSDQKPLEVALVVRMAGIAKTRNWKTKACVLGNLVLHALEETIPANKCPVCNGTKFIEATQTTPMVVCAGCEGTGDRPPLSAHTRAAKIGITPIEFKKIYHRYLSDTIHLIQGIEAVALAEMGGYLSDR